MKESAALIAGLLLTVLPAGGLIGANAFDHRSTTYGEVLMRYLRMPRDNTLRVALPRDAIPAISSLEF